MTTPRAALLAAPAVAVAALVLHGCAHAGPSPANDDAASRAAFLAAYPVFMSPRCVNCHPSGDAPLQGEDSHVHGQNVRRGPDGRGLYALRCVNCHLLANVPGANMPPGNPNWRLPAADMPLVFQGMSPGDLARQLKDPAKNGGKSLDDLLRHVSGDSLVLGAWNPGEGRQPPPLAHDEFARLVRTWVETGAAAPE